MDTATQTAVETAQDAVAAQVEAAAAIENADTAAERAIANAQESIEEAERAAKQIAEAALHNEIMQRVNDFCSKVETCQGALTELQATVATLHNRLTEAEAKMQTQTVTVITPAEPASPTLTPEPSQEVTPAVTVTTVEPGNAPNVSIPAEIPRKIRKRLI